MKNCPFCDLEIDPSILLEGGECPHCQELILVEVTDSVLEQEESTSTIAMDDLPEFNDDPATEVTEVYRAPEDLMFINERGTVEDFTENFPAPDALLKTDARIEVTEEEEIVEKSPLRVGLLVGLGVVLAAVGYQVLQPDSPAVDSKADEQFSFRLPWTPGLQDHQDMIAQKEQETTKKRSRRSKRSSSKKSSRDRSASQSSSAGKTGSMGGIEFPMGTMPNKSSEVAGMGDKSRSSVTKSLRVQINKKMKSLRLCKDRLKKKDPEFSGRFSLRFTITTGGSTKSASIRATRSSDSSFEACVVKKVQGWKFSAQSEEVTIKRGVTIQ